MHNSSSNATRPPRRHQACLLLRCQRRVTRRAPTKRARWILPCLGNFRCSALLAIMHQMLQQTFHQNHGPACFATLHQMAHVTATNQAHNCHRFGNWWLQWVLIFSCRASPMSLEHDGRMHPMARLAMPPARSCRISVNSVGVVCVSGFHMCLQVLGSVLLRFLSMYLLLLLLPSFPWFGWFFWPPAITSFSFVCYIRYVDGLSWCTRPAAVRLVWLRFLSMYLLLLLMPSFPWFGLFFWPPPITSFWFVCYIRYVDGYSCCAGPAAVRLCASCHTLLRKCPH